MALTDQERVDIRRFCGYPMYGGVPSGFQSYRFFQNYGTLEYRMTNLSATEETTLRSIYLTGPNNLYTLEQAVTSASDNLDTDVAAVWTHNKNEVRDRMRLYNLRRRDLCGFLGIPPGDSLAGQGDGASIRLVI